MDVSFPNLPPPQNQKPGITNSAGSRASANAGVDVNISSVTPGVVVDTVSEGGGGSSSVTVTASALPAGASTSALQSSLITAVGTPFQAGGAISNTSFASTVADGADVTQGAKADTVWSGSGAGSIIAILKAIWTALTSSIAISGKNTTTTTYIITLSAATPAQLVASNSTRKGLRWMNIGVNPVTIVSGAGPAVVGNGMAYNGASSAGFQGGSESFEGTGVPTDAFQAISTLGTTVIVWEQN